MLERFPAIARYFGFDGKDEELKTPYQKRQATIQKKKEEQKTKAKQQYEDVLRGIKNYEGSSFLSDLSHTEKRLVRNLRRTGSLTDAVIDAELEKGVVSRAMTAFEHAARGTPLDHVIYENSLAYALVRHPTMFTEDQLKLLRSRLDHGMSMLDFKNEFYKPTMVEDLRAKLLAPKPKSSVSKRDYDFSSCC